MKREEVLFNRVAELIADGEKLLETKYENNMGDSWVKRGMAHQWMTSCLNILGKTYGESSDYYQCFQVSAKTIAIFGDAEAGLGYMRAALEDYEKGVWQDTKTLIEADLFDDFLEQAEALHTASYHQPAAVVAGAVLEDGLRKLCDRNGIALSNKPKLDKMNADLAKKGVYTKLFQKQITVLADMRNKAAHGDWDELTPELVQDMLQQIRRFMAEYLT